MDTPLVSIVIPTYNRPELLVQTLESIAMQTYSNYEVLVVDDGSPTDDAKKVCERFKDVQYIRSENSGGPARPRNIGIQKSKGDYVAFVDDDDIWLPNKLETQVTILENNPDFGLVHGCCKTIDLEGNPSDIIIGRPGTLEEKHGKVSLRMVGNWTLMTPTVLLRKKVIDAVGLFNEDMPPIGEDAEFWIRSSFFTNFYYLDEPLVLYRKHESISVRRQKDLLGVPRYLKEAVLKLKASGMLTKSEFNHISRNLMRMQIKNLKYGFFQSLSFLFYHNPFWFLNFGNIKLFIKKLISK